MSCNQIFLIWFEHAAVIKFSIILFIAFVNCCRLLSVKPVFIKIKTLNFITWSFFVGSNTEQMLPFFNGALGPIVMDRFEG